VSLENATLVIINSIIANNSKNGIRSTKREDTITVNNSVITDNLERGIDCRDGSLILTNSIIYFNRRDIRINDRKTKISYSNIEGPDIYSGPGNINIDPDFTNDFPYNLSPSSPCIDAGDPGIESRDIYRPPSQGTIRNDMGTYGGPEAFGWYPPLYVNPQDINFGNVTKDSSRSIAMKAYNYRQASLSVDVSINGPDSTAFLSDISQFDLSVQDSIDLMVAFNPDTEKTFITEMLFQTAAHGQIVIPLSGSGVLPRLNLLTTEINFGPVPVGLQKETLLLVQNTGTAPLDLSLTPSNQENIFIIEPQSKILPPGSAIDTFRVTFQPDSTILFVDSLLLQSNDPLHLETKIQLSGIGIAPSLQHEPESLRFGEVNVGTDSILYLTITNKGNDVLQIQEPQIASLPPSDNQYKLVDSLTTFPLSLPPGAIYRLLVQFSPSKIGPSDDLLIIKSNDFVHDSITVDLSGIGIKATIDVTPQNLDYGAVFTGKDSIQSLIIANQGNAKLFIDSLRIQEKISPYHLVEPPGDGVSLEPDSVLIIRVAFSPKDTHIYTDSLCIYSNDPVSSSISIGLNGKGIAPGIHISKRNLDYGPVLVSQDSSQMVTIVNQGNTHLIIDSLRIQEKISPFHLSDPPEDGVEINPDSTLDLVFVFSPEKALEYSNSLFIYSNDPLNQTDTIRLSGSGYITQSEEPIIQVSDTLLDFGDVALDSMFNRMLTVYNYGSETLILYRDSLRIIGPDMTSFEKAKTYTENISINPAGSEMIPLDFKPTKTGSHSAFLRIVSNDPNRPNIDISLTGNSIINQEELLIISLDTERSTIPFSFGEPGDLSFIISNSHTVDSTFIYFRSGGGENYTKMPLYQGPGTNNWSIQINSSFITAAGIEYYVSAFQESRPFYFPDRFSKEYNSIIVTVDKMLFPQMTKASVYQMISLPLDTKNQTLSDLFLDNLGTYNNQNYRLFDCYDGISYNEEKDMTGILPPGKAIWLITHNEVQLDISDGQSIPTDTSFNLILKKGWNMVGSPYSFAVNWKEVTNQFVLRDYINEDWGFSTELQPFKGYAVNVPHDTIVSIPSHQETLQKIQSADLPFTWYIQISAQGEKSKDQFNYAGVHVDAYAGTDQFDYPEPPPIGDYICLALQPFDNGSLYSTDIRENGLEGYKYKIHFISNIAGMKSIKLIPNNLPDEFDWMLVSVDEKVMYQKSNIQISKKQGNFELIVGNSDFISKASSGYKLLPLSYHLQQNYPNPFNPITMISYQLAVSNDVELTIYNILGQRVATLVSEVQEAGQYQVKWDARGMASGIYYYQIKSGEFTNVKKMVLLQ